ncbi:MAG: ornithine cyclodeaminase family protein [Steroidobacteraceae bacterium]
MRIVALTEIMAALDEDAAIAAVEEGFRRFSAGEAQVTAVGHLDFPDASGDCHVKGGYLAGDDVFVIKLATSFYRNPEQGLASSNGLMAVMSARTGEVLALLHDEGRLTDHRTAMAGAIAARAIARPHSAVLGVVGSGIQARMQAQLITRHLGLKSVLVWARNGGRAAALAGGLGGQAIALADLCAGADLIVTTTPSRSPLLTAEMVRPGARIVAVGADSPGKQELDARLLARARIVVDSREQCVAHGETGWAVRAGMIEPAALIELGNLLARPIVFRDDEIVVADLTGVAVQDVAIAKSVWRRLENHRSDPPAHIPCANATKR